MNRIVVHVTQERCDACTWEELAKGITEHTQWEDDTKVFAYTESLDACTLEQLAFREVSGKLSKLFKPFEGRIFGATIEARWQLLQEGTWTAWIVREHAAETEGSEPARKCIRSYYLRGMGDEGKDEFHEARYPRRFKYPVRCTKRRDRACIEVAEYRRTEPEWSALSDVRASHALGQPLLFAHRFVAVKAGSGPTETSDGNEEA